MIQNQISKSIYDAQQSVNDISEKISKKQQTILFNKTPLAICEKYMESELRQKMFVNKRKKEAEREMDLFKNEYRTILDDVVKIKELNVLKNDYEKQTESVLFMEKFVKNQTDKVCQIMKDETILDIEEDHYKLTSLGIVASAISEIHPIPFSKLLLTTNYFMEFTPRQLVGLFSCFTDIKIPSDQRCSIPRIDDIPLNNLVKQILNHYKDLESKELELNIYTGINYENALMFDIIDISMKWCDCQTEEDSKYFIQIIINEKEISLGDFTKAMMKIVTVSKEVMNVCEMVGAIDLLHKVNQIDGLLLKYVLTSQSLYV
jgi:hypothetical protein